MDPWFPLTALWLFAPAYLANMSPVVVARLLPRLDEPIDGGRVAADGKPLLGPGKTWRGLVGGTVVGAFTALILAAVHVQWHPPFGGDFDAAKGPATPFVIGLGMGLGALLGDAVKSYFKRRTGRGRGQAWPGYDQLDFVAGGLLVGWLFAALAGSADWFGERLLLDGWVLLFLIVATPLLHLLVNGIGYLLKLKKEPW